MSITPGDRSALIVVDAQKSFMPGGSLAVPRGDEIVPVVNRIAGAFRNVVLTQDWHPPGHISFASSHPGRKPFDTIEAAYGTQVLWPDHCVQGSEGARLHEGLAVAHAQLIIRKGFRREVDSYSAFLEADRVSRTGLDGYLKERGVSEIYVAGLATDFCVAWTALDARKFRLCNRDHRGCVPRHRYTGLAGRSLGVPGRGRGRAGSVRRFQVSSPVIPPARQ